MEFVALTTDRIFPGEAGALNRLFAEGLPVLHLRKPSATEEESRTLLSQIEPIYMGRIVLHDHFGLVPEFGLKGVHLNGRNPVRPGFGTGHVSRSCHSLAEVARYAQEYDYVFLSPVFDSISKSGYGAAFTHDRLLAAKDEGVINDRVYALGGIDAGNVRKAAAYGFGGVAVLGALWNGLTEAGYEAGDCDTLAARLTELLNITNSL